MLHLLPSSIYYIEISLCVLGGHNRARVQDLAKVAEKGEPSSEEPKI